MKYTARNTASLLDIVLEMYNGISKQKAKQVVSFSDFLVNGNKVRNHPKLIIEAGQVVEVIKKIKVDDQPTRPNKKNPVVIYFEDKYLVVGLKPAGILSCKDQNFETAPSFHKLLEAFILERDQQKTRLWPVHRLDKEVEGLIIFAKSENIQELIKENWYSNSKKYLALTEGKPNPENGVIENWLKENRDQRVMVYSKEVEGSKFAKTEYNYIRQEKEFHLLEISLGTGRKNQIRAHLSSIGCPIVGDRRYGADDSVNRQIRLAAYKLEFHHPVTGKLLSFEYAPSSKFFKPSKNEDENYKII
jgi:RluA family pseudouridine synthase